jgi:general secretion pathway protein G
MLLIPMLIRTQSPDRLFTKQAVLSVTCRPSRRVGFTLLELLLVLAILVVLGGIVLVNFQGAQSDANVNATTTQLNALKQSVQYFQIRMNSLPQSLEELKDGPSDAAKKAKWTAPIINEIPKDAWGNDLNYSAKGNTYEIRSGGVDGQMQTDDDIVVSG